jgi:hypothetical protein
MAALPHPTGRSRRELAESSGPQTAIFRGLAVEDGFAERLRREEAAEIIAGGGEHGVDGVAAGVGEVIAG